MSESHSTTYNSKHVCLYLNPAPAGISLLRSLKSNLSVRQRVNCSLHVHTVATYQSYRSDTIVNTHK